MAEGRRVVRICRDTLYWDLHGEAVLLQVETGRYFGLDEAAHRMWRLILQHGDLRLVEEALRSEYAVEPERLDEPGHLLQQFPIHRTALQAHHTTSCYAAARHEVALTPQIFT